MTHEQHIAANIEWCTWQELGKQLIATGAITERDWTSPANLRETPGQRLLAQIREWGQALRAVEKAMPK